MEFGKVQNGYTNNKHRVSTSIEILLCEDEAVCEPKNKTEILLHQFFFTHYIIAEKVQLNDHETYGSSPIHAADYFHS